MTPVMVVDDHTLFREGLRRLLKDTPDLEVAGEAEDGLAALELARLGGWGLMLLDISLPGVGGMEVLRRMRAEGIGLPVLMLSMHPAEQYATQAVRLGAAGYLNKDCSLQQLIDAMRKVAKGGSYLGTHCARDLFFRLARGTLEPEHHHLSPREFEVLIHLAHGRTISGIAALLGVNAKSISTYRARVLQKLGLANNAEIVRYVLAHNLM